MGRNKRRSIRESNIPVYSRYGRTLPVWRSSEYMDEVERLVIAGEIPVERIDEAVSRVLEFK